MILLVASTYTVKRLQIDINTRAAVTITKPEDWIAYLDADREAIVSSINKQTPHGLVSPQEVYLTFIHTQEFHNV